MKHDYRFSEQETSILKSLVGKRLESYRLNDTGNRSFEIFVLRFPETDIELATKEIVGTGDWFEETNTVEVLERPARDSWSRVGKSEPDNGIPAGEFMDYAVDKTVTGVSVIVEACRCGKDVGEFVRGIIVEICDDALVFDKGAYGWEAIWFVTRTKLSSVALASAEYDPVEEPDMSSKTRIVRLT